VAASGLVTLEVGIERHVTEERLRVRDEHPNGVYHLELPELLAQSDANAQRYLFRAVPSVHEIPIVHDVGEARAACDEALRLLQILPRHRQHVKPETLLGV
jgi:hypothetical protein